MSVQSIVIDRISKQEQTFEVVIKNFAEVLYMHKWIYDSPPFAFADRKWSIYIDTTETSKAAWTTYLKVNEVLESSKAKTAKRPVNYAYSIELNSTLNTGIKSELRSFGIWYPMKELATLGEEVKPKGGAFSCLLGEPDLKLKIRLVVIQGCSFEQTTASDVKTSDGSVVVVTEVEDVVDEESGAVLATAMKEEETKN